MEVKELRIGNYVYAFKIIYQIDETDFIGEKISTYKPIPLTEEILLKCGFVFGIKLQDFVKGSYQFIEIKGLIDGYFSEEGIFYYGIKTKICYLHQLQNLYFALTNKELTIDL